MTCIIQKDYGNEANQSNILFVDVGLDTIDYLLDIVISDVAFSCNGPYWYRG